RIAVSNLPLYTGSHPLYVTFVVAVVLPRFSSPEYKIYSAPTNGLHEKLPWK
ncbi:hypothetical protein OMAG_002560, partial [Candidatus Omnitrophus magneticus]